MDEPFGALDEMTREHMQSELLRISAEAGTSVVFVTHSIPEAVFLADRVVVMSPRPGRITEVVAVELGDTRDVDTREDPLFFKKITEVREALAASAPSPTTNCSSRACGVRKCDHHHHHPAPTLNSHRVCTASNRY